MKYNIKEIFYSLQGEGYWTGTPSIFIRFTACNLKCDFCDTDFANGKDYSLDDVVAELAKYDKATHVILTGGEPMLQVDADLLITLRDLNYIVHIETNGTIKMNALMPYFDWITVSPKVNEEWNQRMGHELKVVYVGQDLERYFENTAFEHYYLQPCSMNNTEECVKICKEDPRWRLSIQTHKLLNIQ